MPRFHVRFFKAVITDTGQDIDAVQHAVEVDAADEVEAVEAAKEIFCAERGIKDWRVNAERIEVTSRNVDPNLPDDEPA